MSSAHTLTFEILKFLAGRHKGASSGQIFDGCTRTDCANVFKTMLSNLAKEGLIVNEGRARCACCQRTYSNYRITEQGRIKLARDTV